MNDLKKKNVYLQRELSESQRQHELRGRELNAVRKELAKAGLEIAKLQAEKVDLQARLDSAQAK